MRIFPYRSGQTNEQLFVKAGLDRSRYSIDFTDGLGTSATLNAVTCGAVNSSNVDITSVVVASVTTTTSVATVLLLTGSTGGTTAPANETRIRVRTTATTSDSRTLIQDTFLYVNNPVYSPDS